ncbi:glycoside hydrolase family 97 catalytic domain-containing protein [Alteromonadaceae bacterium BrNp21-10]|nr:glycoside hydrolase family 97 catalytic domain-containing protein [Alteromonadaceae bacterium BrNp21-10]
MLIHYWNKAALCCCLFLSLSAQSAWQNTVVSPDENLSAVIELTDQGQLQYQLFRQGNAVMLPSPLGISLEKANFVTGLRYISTSAQTVINDEYRMWTGKQKHIRYVANERVFSFENSEHGELQLAVRMSDDGMAFRYQLPGQYTQTQQVLAESTGFHFYPESKAWLQFKADAQTGWMNTNPSYEEDYLQEIAVGTPSPTKSGWVYPALFKCRDSWIVISETGMTGDYSGSNLAQNSDGGLYQLRLPDAAETIKAGQHLPKVTLPFSTPWRLLVVGDLATVTNSTLGTDLAPANQLANTDFIQPGISAWSWGLMKDDATIYPVQKDFIDYASEMHWPYVLVDADWDQKIGYDKIAELAKYAESKNVGLLLWYNSSGPWNNTVYSPKSALLTHEDRVAEFAKLQAMGIRGVKIDFFPGDGASVMQYYIDILQDAAAHELLVNFHGSVLPRGIQRTYPNFVTSEAIKGLEMITFNQDVANNEARHVSMLPFTRNLFDPMDFTPMVLGDIPNIERKTTNGFQLALPVLFLSGIQHLVTTPPQMQKVPEYVKAYLQQVPGQWDESRFIQGSPGKLAVIARRSGEHWYVAGVNGEQQQKQLLVDLRFLGEREGTLITDGDGPRSFSTQTVNSGMLPITVGAAGGFVIRF